MIISRSLKPVPTSQRKRFCSLFAALAVLGIMRLSADVVTVVPSADVGLREIYPQSNEGLFPTVVSGTQGPNTGPLRNRAIFKFDLAESIPPGSVVQTAHLVLHVAKVPLAPAPSSTFQLHRMLRSWAESEATWQNASGAEAWLEPGVLAEAEYVTTISSSRLVSGLGSYTFASTPTMVADLQAWVNDPGANFGWILISDAEDVEKTARRFTTREDSTSPPQLTIDFSPAPARPRIEGMEVAAGEFRFRFRASANQSYSVERRAMIDSGSWTIIANIPPQDADFDALIADPLGPDNHFYRVSRP